MDTDGDGIDDVITVANLNGNLEPNSPKHRFAAELRGDHPSGLFGVVSLRHFSDAEVNDENVSKNDSATISDVRVGFDWLRDSLRIQPFFGVLNWTDTEYNGTVRVNDANGRYYEPAAETQYFGGLELEYVHD